MFFVRYFDFEGRSRRAEYWWVSLFHLILFTFLLVLAFLPGSINYETGEPGPIYFLLVGIVALYSLGTVIPGLALIVRRLHDVNLSGWLLLALFVPLVNFFAWIGLFIVCLIPGTVGPNKYGLDPKTASLSAADIFA